MSDYIEVIHLQTMTCKLLKNGELIEEYNKLTNKYKILKNDNSLYKRK